MATKQSTPSATENPVDTLEPVGPSDRIFEPQLMGLKIPEAMQVVSDSPEENNYFDYYRDLYQSASEGDLKRAESFLKRVPDALTKIITRTGMTALHVAALYQRTEMVEWLVKDMPEDALLKRTHEPEGCTALHYAVMSGNLKMADILIRKNRRLTQIPSHLGCTPLLCAVIFFPNRKLVAYLVKKTTDDPPRPFSDPYQAGQLICYLTTMGFHDIVLSLLRDHPSLAWAENSDGRTILGVLANEPQHFPSGTKLKLWQRRIYQFLLCGADDPLENPEDFVEIDVDIAKVYQRSKVLAVWRTIKENLLPCIKHVQDAKLAHNRANELVDRCLKAFVNKYNADAREMTVYVEKQKILENAACYGITEIVTKCLKHFPELIWSPSGLALLKTAVEWRQEEIFDYMYRKTALGKLLAQANYGRSILHLVAEEPKCPQVSNVYGAGLQMQREVKWFKLVESIAHPAVRRMKLGGKTGWQLFKKTHEKMRDNAEKWYKDTSNSCMLVSTLIATVVFAVAFTVPGGNNSEGTPIFLKKPSFMVFALSDALALFLSLISILMFLSILTSPYKEEDFHRSLPKRMIIGLASLFFAIATMMVAFVAALTIVLNGRFEWILCPIILLASLPVTLFLMQQRTLFVTMVQSTCGHHIFQPEKIW